MPDGLRYAVRRLRRSPGFALTIVLTFAVSLAAATAVLTFVNGVLLTPLPFAAPDEIVRLREERDGAAAPLDSSLISNDTWHAWRRGASRTLVDLAGHLTRSYDVGLDDGTARLTGTAVTVNLFDLLGTTPARGRLFGAADASADVSIVVLSHSLWRERFGGADVIGRALAIGGRPHTVVGVAREDFAFPDRDSRLWTPYVVEVVASSDDAPASARPSWFQAVGRLKPEASAVQAEAELTTLARGADRRSPHSIAMLGGDGPLAVRVVPLLDDVTKSVRPGLVAANVGILFLLLLACANAANLLLVRGAARRQEVAVCAALGAGRSRLVRQMLVEMCLLVAAAGVLGSLLAALIVSAAPAFLPVEFPRLDEVHVDGTLLAAAAVGALLVALVSGVIPAWRASRADLWAGLRSSDGVAIEELSGRRATIWRDGLIAVEAALAVLLMVGAILAGRSFVRLISVDKGYDATNVLTARVHVAPGPDTAVRNRRLLDNVLERLRGVDGVVAAGGGNMMPFDDSTFLTAFGLPPIASSAAPVLARAVEYAVSPGYAEALGLSLREGRFFTDRDRAAGIEPVIVNREFARLFLAPGPVVGRRFDGFSSSSRTNEIVGVVDNVLKNGLSSDPQPSIFVPIPRGSLHRELYLVVRTRNQPSTVAPLLRRIVREHAPTAALASVTLLSTLISESVARPRAAGAVFGAFAGLGLGLAAVGLASVLAYSVSRRQRELAIRAALGARRRDQMWIVVRQALVPTGAGLVAGLAVAAALTRLWQDALFRVSPFDPVAFVSAALLLMVVAVGAAAVPASRASRVDPVQSLRMS